MCCGPNCAPRGSVRLLGELEAEVERRGLGDTVGVRPAGCQGHCDSGPTMVVYPGPVYYQEIDRLRLVRIVAEHFERDAPVREFFWKGHSQPRKRPAWQSRVAFTPDSSSAPTPQKQGQTRSGPHKRHTETDADDFKW